MGLVWREVHILAQRATTPRKGFFYCFYCHTYANRPLYIM
jgi:hypothetical protein